jgi:hypothetical protein
MGRKTALFVAGLVSGLFGPFSINAQPNLGRSVADAAKRHPSSVEGAWRNVGRYLTAAADSHDRSRKV